MTPSVWTEAEWAKAHATACRLAEHARCLPPQSAIGKKFDTDKDRWDLLDTPSLRDVVRVLTVGAKKYGDDDWRRVPDARRRYYAAALRHVTAWWGGESADKDDGLPHLAHAMCCLMFLLAHDRLIHQ